MPESTELTDYQKATAVARYVEIEEIGLDQVQGRLLVPRDVALSSAPWEISFEKSATFSFVENSKRLATTLSITGRVVPKNASERGIVGAVVQVLAHHDISIRQIFVTDPEFSEEPKLVIIIEKIMKYTGKKVSYAQIGKAIGTTKQNVGYLVKNNSVL